VVVDHAEVRRLLELAAVEPDGLARLEAGDAPEAAAVAGHLAGCPACAGELDRLRAATLVVRDALRSGADQAEPSDDLRERTLAYVREVGRERGPARVPAPATPPVEAHLPAAASGGRRRVAWWGQLAAALVIGAGLGGLVGGSIVGRGYQATVDAAADTVATLTRVNGWTLRLAGEPDSRSVALRSATVPDAWGSLLFSPATTEVVVMMDGVAAPPEGREYRCWVRVGETTTRVGRMYFGGGLGYWAGTTPAVAAVPAGSTFGVSLVDVTSGTPVGDPVLLGSL